MQHTPGQGLRPRSQEPFSTEIEEQKKLISKRRFLLRLRGAAAFMHVKMKGKGFEQGQHLGIFAHHCFVVDLESPG